MAERTAHILKISGRHCVMAPDADSPIGYSVAGEHALLSLAQAQCQQINDRLRLMSDIRDTAFAIGRASAMAARAR